MNISINDLSDEQKELIQRTENGENVLVDACIGSGKTTAIQVLCNEFSDKRILYLTYNRLLKIDAKSKITARNVCVTNYHGFAFMALSKMNIRAGISDLIQSFNRHKPALPHYDMLVLDEYQDIEQEIAEMLLHIKAQNPDIQIIAVGDMKQKIYDKTTINVPVFINDFLGEYTVMQFTKCFRLSSDIASRLGNIWEKNIKGVNRNCHVESMTFNEITEFLSNQKPSDILCLGARTGAMSKVLNILERDYPETFNKKTVYASIADEDRSSSAPTNDTAIFTTYDSSKGLERKICVVFDYTEEYWQLRLDKPMVDYEILRNIFCVAASRGKERIIFAKNFKYNPLSDRTLSTRPLIKNGYKKPFNVSEMFSFRYKEDVEECYGLISSKRISNDDEPIYIKGNDGLIDLSPCIGIYQEANFFRNYDIDSEIAYSRDMHSDRPPLKIKKNADLEEKILYLTAYETYYDRYVTQVICPFVTNEQTDKIYNRLKTVFTPDETVQKECSIKFYDNSGKGYEICGRADVLKDDVVYELKFVSELNHEHFLQCACYMIALGLKKGVLWNTQNNAMYEITIPDRAAFINAVVKTITKQSVTQFKIDDKYCCVNK